MYEDTNGKQKKGMNKGIMLGAVAAVIAIFAIVFVTTRPEKIELADYLMNEPEYSGFNGHAELPLEQVFDERGLSSFVYSRVEGKSSSKDTENMSDEALLNAMENGWESLGAAEQILSDIQVNVYVNGTVVEECNNLSNGDKIKVVVDAKNPVNKELNLKLVSGEKEFIVGGLADGTPLSAFDDGLLEVSFEGMSGEGTVIIRKYADEIEGFAVNYYVKNNTFKYKNSDVVVIQADCDKELLESGGYYLEEETKEYVVSGLAELVTIADDIPDAFLDEIRNKFNEKANNYFNRVFIGAGNNDIVYETTYFAVAKSEDAQFKNCILVVGKYINANSGEEMYCYSLLRNLTVSEDGMFTFGGGDISECRMDIDNWGLDLSGLNQIISSDVDYEYTEI